MAPLWTFNNYMRISQPARSSSDTKILPIHPRQDEDLEGRGHATVIRPGGWGHGGAPLKTP